MLLPGFLFNAALKCFSLTAVCLQAGTVMRFKSKYCFLLNTRAVSLLGVKGL